MGYAIKIPSVDFSSIAVGQVTYVEPIPCIAIALDHDTLTFSRAEEMSQLTATLTPADTTDSVTWSSSNENVATVSATGLVTIHGIGSATITATCGEQTAICSITQSTIKAQYDFTILANNYPEHSSSSSPVITMNSTSGQKSFGQAYHAANEDLHILYTTDLECIRVPYGATTMFIAAATGENPIVSYVEVADTDTLVTKSSKQYPMYTREKTSVYANTGMTVEYGECVVLRILDAQAVNVGDYVYFT